MSIKLKDNLLANIPSELQASSRWVLWRLEDTPPLNGKAGRPRCKIPKKCSDPKFNASSTGPESWGNMATALNNLPLLKPEPQYRDELNPVGVGLTFGAPFFGVDLDKCFDEEQDAISPWALEVLSKLPPTYCELSPSHKGFHLWYKCPEHSKLKDGVRTEKAEVYARGRYFTMTGEPVEVPMLGGLISREELSELDLKEANKVYAIIEALKVTKKTEPAAPASTNSSAKLQDLMTRTDFPDASQAVQSLLTILAIETVCDLKEMETRFKQSKLYQDTHWKEKWERLGASELEKAAVHGRENLLKRKEKSHRRTEYETRVEVTQASKFVKRHQKYFWEPWLPIGQLVHFGGGQGQGKSPVVLDIAARMTAGSTWPDESAIAASRSVLLLNIEDDISSVTIPRFELAGGNLEKLFIVQCTKMKPISDDPEAEEMERNVALDKDVEQLSRIAKDIPDLGLIIVDPITNYLGSAKMNDEIEVRNVLTPLATLAQQLGVMVATVGHFNRREKGTDPLSRVMGAAAFTGVARGVVLFGPDNDSESTHAHVMTLGRGATESGGMKYHTDVEEMEWDGDKSKVVKICWDGKAEVHADDAVDAPSRQEKSKVKEAAELITQFLMSGKKPASECLSYLERNGFDPKSVNPVRVRKLARIGTKQEGSRNHVWYLVSGAEEPGGMF